MGRGWLWIPTLYFLEGIPNSVVSDTAGFFYNDLGLTAAQLGLITGWMYLPWVIKPLWSPIVDLIKTKRWWIIATQLTLGACFLALAGAVHTPHWLLASAAVFWIMAFVSATHDIAADGFYMLGLTEPDQAKFTGVRTTAYRAAMLSAKGPLVYAAGTLSATMAVSQGWSIAMCIPGLVFLLLAFYHWAVLPHPETDVAAPTENFVAGYIESFRSFFAKPGILKAIAFMLLFRLAEAQILTVLAPFLTGAREVGGLGLATRDVGVAYGTYGVLGLICGGISAGFLVARYGLRRLYWILIFTMHVPNAAFLYLAFVQPTELWLISMMLFIEQFGYGFGFTAYTLFLLYFAKGPLQTSHYAIGTGFMALSIMLPRMAAGYVKDALGFHDFFIYVMVCTIPSFVVAWLAWRDQKFIDTFQPKKA